MAKRKNEIRDLTRYPWRKGIAAFTQGKDLFLSVPFTWLLEEANEIAALWPETTYIGGPALMRPNEIEPMSPISLHNPFATFTTRGCPNHCAFCAVPKLEPTFKEIENFKPAPIICDNNLLAASNKHLLRVVDASRHFYEVDFNQGFEARRFTTTKADILSALNCKVRFAFDHVNDETPLKDAIDLCKKRVTKKIGVYVLIGFNDTPEDARYRLDKVRGWGILPNPMRFQPLNAKKKNAYVGKNWPEAELKKMMRYYSRLIYTSKIPYEEFRNVR